MKRVLLGMSLLMGALQVATFGQEATALPTATAAPVSDELYRKMAADLESLQSANVLLQKKISALEDEVRSLRDDLTKASANSSVKDDLKSLAEKIQEVDRKRESDKQVISDEIRKSINSIVHGTDVASHSSGPKTAPPTTTVDPAILENAYSYTIQANDTLSAIVAAYNAEFKSKGMKTVTLKQVMDANPTVNWNKLQVGKKIVIPKPAAAK
jgi:LysM repeat protein